MRCSSCTCQLGFSHGIVQASLSKADRATGKVQMLYSKMSKSSALFYDLTQFIGAFLEKLMVGQMSRSPNL